MVSQIPPGFSLPFLRAAPFRSVPVSAGANKRERRARLIPWGKCRKSQPARFPTKAAYHGPSRRASDKEGAFADRPGAAQAIINSSADAIDGGALPPPGGAPTTRAGPVLGAESSASFPRRKTVRTGRSSAATPDAVAIPAPPGPIIGFPLLAFRCAVALDALFAPVRSRAWYGRRTKSCLGTT